MPSYPLCCMARANPTTRVSAQLIQTHDFPGLITALTGGGFEPDFFASWIRRAGGYFPKFAQVLSVRPDLIHDRAVLEALSRCLEDMPPRPDHEVRVLLRQQGFDESMVGSLRECLKAGSVAQVHRLELPDGGGRNGGGEPGVVKVTWPSARERVLADFRLFGHARQILGALSTDEGAVRAVGAMFEAVGRAEGETCRCSAGRLNSPSHLQPSPKPIPTPQPQPHPQPQVPIPIHIPSHTQNASHRSLIPMPCHPIPSQDPCLRNLISCGKHTR